MNTAPRFRACHDSSQRCEIKTRQAAFLRGMQHSLQTNVAARIWFRHANGSGCRISTSSERLRLGFSRVRRSSEGFVEHRPHLIRPAPAVTCQIQEPLFKFPHSGSVPRW
eukprot:1318012-Rhodomonas_salina.3